MRPQTLDNGCRSDKLVIAARVLVRPPNRCAARHFSFCRLGGCVEFPSTASKARFGLVEESSHSAALVFAAKEGSERLRLELARNGEIQRLAAEHRALRCRHGEWAARR